MICKFGSANPSVVGPTGKRVNTTTPRGGDKGAPANLLTKTLGVGTQVTDVVFDSDTRELIVTKSGIFTAEVDGARIGKTQYAIPDAGTVPDSPDEWFPDPSPAGPNPTNQLFPLRTYEHVDGWIETEAPRKNLPTGYGFVRLEQGSIAAGNSAWDADSATFGLEEEPAETHTPSLIKATVDTANEFAVITLWYDTNIHLRLANYGTNMRKDMFTVTSSSGTRIRVKQVTEGPTENSKNLILDRSALFEENLKVQVKDAFFKGGSSSTDRTPVATSSTLEVAEALPRNCYVLAVNTTGETIPADTRVLLTKPLKIFDNGLSGDKQFVYVWTIVPMAGGGGGTPVSYLPANVKSTTKSLPIGTNPVGPVDWTDYELPIDFEHTDTFPGGNLPRGIGWVRLAHASDTIDGNSWDADIFFVGTEEATGGIAPVILDVQIRDNNQLWVWFDQPTNPVFTDPLLNGPPDTWDDYFTFNVGMGEPVLNVVNYVGAGNIDGDPVTNVIVYEVEQGAAPGTIDWELYAAVPTVDISGGIGENTLTPADVNPAIAAEELRYSLARNCYVLVMNRAHEYSYRIGDTVSIVSNNFLNIADEQDPANTVKVYDALGQMRGVNPGVYTAKIIGGQTLDSGGSGIVYTSVASNINSAIDIYADPALNNGIGYAYLYIDGEQQFIPDPITAGQFIPLRVLIVNDTRGSIGQALMQGEVIRLSPDTIVMGTYIEGGITKVNNAYTLTGF